METEGKKITCRAAVVWKANTEFIIETVEIDPPKSNEVRIKMTSAGLCHTDLYVQEDGFLNYPFPTVLGHEGAGIVESVGFDVSDIAPGDTVVLLAEPYCGKCKKCRNPLTNACDTNSRNYLLLDGTSRIKCRGQQLSIMNSIGTFSEYVVANEISVAKVNSKAPLNKIAVASCCIPTGYGAAVECAKVRPGSTCAIWGLGGVGMNVVMGCRDSKASKIIGIDLNPEKFTTAQELGCTQVVNPKDCSESISDILQKMTDGGPDYCFVSVGSVSAMEEAFKSSHPRWGQTIIIGLSELTSKIRFGICDLLGGRMVKGTVLGSYKTKLAIPTLVDKVVDNEIQIDKLVTHIIPLDDITKGFKMLSTGKSIRTVIDFCLKK